MQSTIYKKRLRAELERLRGRNPRFSMRSYARLLGIAPSTLLSVMNGGRHFRVGTATRVANALKWSENDYRQMLSEILASGAVVGKPMLSQNDFHDLNEWHLMAIARLALLKNVEADPVSIARYLEIPVKRAQQALTFLEKQGYLSIHAGKLKPGKESGPFAVTKPDKKTIEYQQSLLKKASEALQNVPVSKRLSLIRMIPLNPDALFKLEGLISRFAHRAALRAEPENAQELYCLTVQVFPLTRISRKKNPKR